MTETMCRACEWSRAGSGVVVWCYKRKQWVYAESKATRCEYVRRPHGTHE